MDFKLDAEILNAMLERKHHLSDTEPSPLEDGQQNAMGDNIVYLLALEGHTPKTHSKWWEKAIDTIIQALQPVPALTHVELFVPPLLDGDEMHFAIYLGRESGWESAFGVDTDYYLSATGNARSWRAIPIVAKDAVRRVREECNTNAGTAYASVYRLFNYIFSIPPLRAFAWTLDDSVKSPAHCGSLTARCLKRAVPEIDLPNSSAWYGPSTLFLELLRHSRVTSYARQFAEAVTVKSTVESEDTSSAIETLLRGSDEAVEKLAETACKLGIEQLAERAIAASIDRDPTAERERQKDLARAILRFSLLNKRAQSAYRRSN